MRRRGPSASVLLLVVALSGACAGAGPAASPTADPTSAATASPTASPEPSPTEQTPEPAPTASTAPSPSPSPARTVASGGSPSGSCVEGWQSSPAGSFEHGEGLERLTLEMGLESELEMAELRYFTGPDVWWIIEPHYPVVQRWYVKGRLSTDPSFAGRWLIEQRSDEVWGIAAVAPFDSEGLSSPDWVGFFGEGPPRVYEQLPGQWSGIPYDFVTGEGDGGFPGLPDEVVGCLEGT